MFVRPMCLFLCIIFPVGRWWWRICDFCDEECCRSLSDTVDQDTKQGYLEEDEEPYAETE